MFVAIYRWRVFPESDAAFRDIWHRITRDILRLRGSHGSRLHKSEEPGVYVAIALWPSRELWEATEPALPDEEANMKLFWDTIAEAFPVQVMTVIDDLWRLP